MSDRYYSGSYGYSYQPHQTSYSSNRYGFENQYAKPGNDRKVDIKQSNISQQTIIHKARLYSPDKSQDYARNNFSNSQAYDKTKAKKTEITAKIHEIVDMCENDKDAEINQFKEVIQAEKKILGMLHQTNPQEQSNLNIDLTHFGQNNQDRGTTFGPIRNQSYPMQKIQSKQVTQRQVQNSVKQTAARDNNIYKKSAIDDLKTDRNAEQNAQPFFQNQTKQIRSQPVHQYRQLVQRDGFFNDQTQKMIEQIQRKAMDEIQSLRNDKIQLMKRLNQQIRAHNQQKKLRIRLQQELARLKGQQNVQPARQPANFYNNSNQHRQSTQPAYEASQGQQKQRNQGTSQTYYPPYQGHGEQNQQIISNQQIGNNVKHRQPQQPNIRRAQSPQSHVPSQQNLMAYERQIYRLQQENNNLMKTLRYGQAQAAGIPKSSQKQQLRSQVNQLYQLIAQYQAEIEKAKVNRSSGNQIGQLQRLFQQGERIQQDTLRLIRKNEQEGYGQGNQMSSINQNIFRNEISRNQVIQDANNFKKRLVEEDDQQNGRSNNYIKYGSRKDISDDYRASLPNLNTNYQSNTRMQQFERLLGDLKTAAR